MVVSWPSNLVASSCLGPQPLGPVLVLKRLLVLNPLLRRRVLVLNPYLHLRLSLLRRRVLVLNPYLQPK